MTRFVAQTALVCGVALVSSVLGSTEFHRQVGVYPGDPAEDFSPSLVTAPAGRRNLALHRATSQSSAYDYNLTSQLLTDGIREVAIPRWFSVSTSEEGQLAKRVRELVVDDNVVSGVNFDGPGWLAFRFAGGAEPLVFDRVEIGLVRRNWMPFGPTVPSPVCIPSPWGPPVPETDKDEDLDWSLAISSEGREWTEVGAGSVPVPAAAPVPKFEDGLGRIFNWMVEANPPVWTSVSLEEPVDSRRIRIQLDDLECKQWSLAEVRFFRRGERVFVGGPHHFGSAWKSAGLGEEWVAVDLGGVAKIDSVALSWLAPAGRGEVQVSDDGVEWSQVAELAGSEGAEEIELSPPARARHLRVVMNQPTSADGYVLSELEVLGEGGVVAEAHPPSSDGNERSVHLAGGGWRLQRSSQVEVAGSSISTVGFADGDWVVATVPGTVLTSYLNIGALPDVNFGDNELVVSDSFFHSDFWYRNEFEAPDMEPGERAFLELDGINWKAEVYCNGAHVGRLEGAFHRGRFDVTDHLEPSRTNALAILIERTATPGSAKQHNLETAGYNGGAIGADNPSYHASIGWDWIPTIRGRNIGIWNDVRLKVTGAVTLEDPFVRFELPLPETSTADLFLEVDLTNHSPERQSGVLRGTFGKVTFEQQTELEAGESRTLALDPTTHTQLRLQEPELWWPNGHGEPHLYDVDLEFLTDVGVSDAERFKSGVRQMTFSEEDEALRIFVNGRRVVPRGGNWGFSEAHLRYRGREYDTAMKYHRDMNFTMVRNWVGQTGDQEFYEAADRHGILIWQDFWLANPLDGPDPENEELFMTNVRDTLRRIRNHPSVGLYCGRNEGHPPASLDAEIAAAIADLHPEIHYIPNSISGSVSGGGPYGVQPREYYFTERATPKPHSELGMTSVVTLDSLRRMMPASELWPLSLHWGLHDFNLESNQRAEDFVAMIEESYGGARDLAEWMEIAQLVNYDGYRAMFEAQSQHRMGIQLWMSHPAWPSLTWQTYDYYFNPHASYWGSRKGSEPLHIQWNPITDEVEVVNYGVPAGLGLKARAQILDLDGTVRWQRETDIESPSDSTVAVFPIEYPADLTAVHFIRLQLIEGESPVSENFYWRGTESGNYRALRTLPRVSLTVTTESERQDDAYLVTTRIANRTQSPAIAVRVVALGSRSGAPQLPVLHSDNFLSLMPGEERTIKTRILLGDARGEEPQIRVEGFNVTASDDSLTRP